MFNVVKRSIYILAIMFFASCTSKSNPNQEAAQALIERINIELENNNPAHALELMDSVDALYADQIRERKIVKALRPRAIEALTISQIIQADSLIATAQLELESLHPKMKHIDGGGLEGYYVVADAYNPGFINSSGFEPRVNDTNNMFYIVAINNGKKIGISHLGLIATNEACESMSLSSRQNQSDVIEGSELASFLPEEVNDLGQWAYEHLGNITSGVIYGNNGNVNVKFTPKQADAFGIAWRYAYLKEQERRGLILREKLDRKLQIARDQAANAALDSIE